MKIETKKEKKIEPKTIISWMVLVLFFAIIVLVYVLFDKKPTPKPASLENLEKATEEAYQKLENPTPQEELRNINIKRRSSNQTRTPLEELQRLNVENDL